MLLELHSLIVHYQGAQQKLAASGRFGPYQRALISRLWWLCKSLLANLYKSQTYHLQTFENIQCSELESEVKHILSGFFSSAPPQLPRPWMGYPHWPKVSTLDIAMVVQHRDHLNWPAAPFISQRRPTDPNGRLSVWLTQRQYKLVSTVAVQIRMIPRLNVSE